MQFRDAENLYGFSASLRFDNMISTTQDHLPKTRACAQGRRIPLFYILLFLCAFAFSSQGNAEETPEDTFFSGIREMDEEKYEQAIQSFNKSITLAKNGGKGLNELSFYYLALAVAHEHKKDYPSALASYKRARDLCPQNEMIESHIHDLEAKKYEEALEGGYFEFRRNLARGWWRTAKDRSYYPNQPQLLAICDSANKVLVRGQGYLLTSRTVTREEIERFRKEMRSVTGQNAGAIDASGDRLVCSAEIKNFAENSENPEIVKAFEDKPVQKEKWDESQPHWLSFPYAGIPFYAWSAAVDPASKRIFTAVNTIFADFSILAFNPDDGTFEQIRIEDNGDLLDARGDLIFDSAGRLFISSGEGAYRAWTAKEGISRILFPSVSGKILAHARDEKGVVYFASSRKIYQLTDGKMTPWVDLGDSLSKVKDLYFLSLAVSGGRFALTTNQENANLIMGNEKGMQKTFKTKDFDDLYELNKLFFDSKGNLWANCGQAEGVFRIAPDYKMERFTEKQGLKNLSLNSFAEDEKGRVWIGTENGLGCYDNCSWKWLTFRDGLLDRKAMVATDTAGRIYSWSSKKGLSVLAPPQDPLYEKAKF